MRQICEICAVARKALEPGLRGFPSGKPDSKGACLHASYLLKTLLEKFAGCRAQIRGGGDGDGGALDSAGEWRGHYWVEAIGPDGGHFVADITADQFGYASVIVMPIKLADDRYRPGDQEAVDAAVVALEEFLACERL